MTHTPGPWKIARNYLNRLAIVGPANNGHDTTSDRICNLPHRRDQQGEANAALVASAPDLLKRLEALADEADRVGNTLSRHGIGATVLAMHTRNARKAIAAATDPGDH